MAGNLRLNGGIAGVLLAAVAATLSAAAHSEEKYPVRPVRVIVPFAPGGGSDITARLITPRLSQRLGQQFVIDNRAGAGGNVGMELAAKAAPDGYTIMVVSSSYAANAVLHKLAYDPITGFEPITLITTQPLVLAVHPGVPVGSVKDLIALARAKPGSLTYASSGTGGMQHLGTELFKNMARIDLLHIPYKGTGPALNDFIAGQVQVYMASVFASLAHVRSGMIKALAVTGAKRSDALPDVPTVAEAGVPGYVFTGWYCMLAPAKTPRHIVELLNAETVAIVQSPEVRDKLLTDGGNVVASTPEQLGAHIRSEVGRLSKLAADANIRLDSGR